MDKSFKSLILEVALLLILVTIVDGVFISVVSIIIHEIAHVIVGNFYGCKIYKFKVSVTGANAKLDNILDLKEFQKFNLYMAGPAANLCIFIICTCIGRAIPNPIVDIIGGINLGLFLFNILPAYPLDGSRLLEILLTKQFTYRKSKKIIEIISYICSGLFLITFIYTLFLHRLNISLLLVGMLIIYSAYIERKSTIYIMMCDLFKKGRLIEKYEYIDNRSISVSYKNNLLNLLRMIDKNKFNSFFILNEELKVLEIVHEDELIEALKNNGNISLEEYLKIKKENELS